MVKTRCMEIWPNGPRLERVSMMGHRGTHLGDGGTGEGVGAQKVGTGLQVLPVDLLDDLRLSQRQHVVVALHQLVVVGETLPLYRS